MSTPTGEDSGAGCLCTTHATHPGRHLQGEGREGDEQHKLVQLRKEAVCGEDAQPSKEPASADEEDELDDHIHYGLQDPA